MIGRISNLWNVFWFAERSSELLAFTRIAVAAAVILKFLGLHGLYRIERWKITWPWERPVDPAGWVGAGDYVPQMPGLGWIPVMDAATGQASVAWFLLLALLMLLGLATRLVIPTLTLLFGWSIFYTSMDYRHHENVLFWTLVALCTAPCADHYSLDARFGRAPPPTRPIVHLRMLQVLVTTIYASTTLGKLDSGWWSGAAMQSMFLAGHFRGPYWPTIWELTGPVFLSRYTVFVEALCAVGFWIPRLRLPTALLGAGLHLGIDLMMPVTTFSWQMISLYAVFFDPTPGSIGRTLAPAAWLARIRSGFSARSAGRSGGS